VYVRLERHGSGGVYIYLIKNPDDPRSEGYDQFALNEADLANQLKGLGHRMAELKLR